MFSLTFMVLKIEDSIDQPNSTIWFRPNRLGIKLKLHALTYFQPVFTKIQFKRMTF